MDEKTVLALLAQLISRYLNHNAGLRDVPSHLAPDVANAAWDALILLMRQTLVTESTITLADIGVFERYGESWTFAPAATLIEAASLKLPPETGQADIAAMLVFHVQTAERLLDNLSRDIRVSASPPYGLELGGELYERAVSDVVSELANRLRQKSEDLKSREKSDEVPLMLAAPSATGFFAGPPSAVAEEIPLHLPLRPPFDSGA
jgi:hypothetical protein